MTASGPSPSASASHCSTSSPGTERPSAATNSSETQPVFSPPWFRYMSSTTCQSLSCSPAASASSRGALGVVADEGQRPELDAELARRGRTRPRRRAASRSPTAAQNGHWRSANSTSVTGASGSPSATPSCGTPSSSSLDLLGERERRPPRRPAGFGASSAPNRLARMSAPPKTAAIPSASSEPAPRSGRRASSGVRRRAAACAGRPRPPARAARCCRTRLPFATARIVRDDRTGTRQSPEAPAATLVVGLSRG